VNSSAFVARVPLLALLALAGLGGCRHDAPDPDPIVPVAASVEAPSDEEAGAMTPLIGERSGSAESLPSRVPESEVPPVDPTAAEPTGADLAQEEEPETIQRLADGRVQARYSLEMSYREVVAFYDAKLDRWTRRELDLAPLGESTTEWESPDRLTIVTVSAGPDEGATRVIIVGPESVG